MNTTLNRIQKVCCCFVVFLGLILHITELHAQALEKIIVLPEGVQTGKSLLALIEKQQGIRFSFDEKAGAKLEKVITLSNSKPAVKTILDKIRQQAGLQYSISDNYIIFKDGPVKTLPGNGKGTITGKIIDEESGEAVEGASIRIGEEGAISGNDGSFLLLLPHGTYTASVSSIGYSPKEITEITLRENSFFELNLTIKRKKGSLQGVVVSVNARKAGVAALYTQQKNNASITDGISAQQIAATPDNNMGQVLKRVSGVTTVDNRYIVVRGLSERYNQGMIDGVILPSTDMNRRNFSFDVVPAEMVSSVVVNKTATPDMSAEFAGGQVIINTLDIPTANFTILTLGTGMNTNTTGKDFIQVGGRGKYDFLAFDDGHRKMPFNIRSWLFANQSDVPPDYAIDQSRSLDPNGFKRYHYKAGPNFNNRLSLGRTYKLKNNLRFGLITGVSMRSSLETDDFKDARFYTPGDIDSARIRSNGNIYKYNSAIGAQVNMGLQGKTFRIGFRNLYSRSMRDYFYTSEGLPYQDQTQPREQKNVADPEITTVLQHKLDGEHTIGKTGIKWTWSGSVTSVSQQTKDRRKFNYRISGTDKGVEYYQTPAVIIVSANDPRFDYRIFTDTKQTDYNWGTGLSRSFQFLGDKTLIKAGYAGWHKGRDLYATRLDMYTANINGTNNSVTGLYEDVMSPERVGYGYGMAYYVARADYNGPQFKGVSNYSAGYLMLDQHFLKKLRLVYGVRGEKFEIRNNQLKQKNYDLANFGEKNWKWLPSANLTYSLTDKMNFRAAYSKTLIRPDFRETSAFGMYDPYLNADIAGSDVKSTDIRNYDLRYEWYPAPGEIISISAFYKEFDKPMELVPVQDATGTVRQYEFQNQKNAMNKGLELEIRKSLSFIADRPWLNNIIISGNASLIASRITELQYDYLGVASEVPGVKRPLYGQSPWLINAGIGYNAPSIGGTLSYNRAGYRTYIIRQHPGNTEYENGRNLVDLQLYGRIMKQKLEVKLNISNLLNTEAFYYRNYQGYTSGGSNGLGYIKVEGKGTDKFEKQNDAVTYRIRYGSTVSLSLAYRF